MTFRDQILTALVGPEGAQALRKAAERLPHLDNAMVPRALYAWVRLAGHGYEGEVPGVGGGHLTLRKSGDAFAGAMALGDINYDFDDASLLHVAAALGVVMGLERNRVPENVTDEDLYRLGKSVDALVSARVAHAVLKKKMSEKPEFSFEHEHDVTSQPSKTVVYALDVAGKEIGKAVAIQTTAGADLQSLTVDRRRHPTLQKKLLDAIEGVVGELRKSESSLPPHSLMSAENPLFPVKSKLSNSEAVQKLRDMGEDAHATVGSYGKPENSMIIYHPKNQKAIEDFARDLGQESIIHSDGANHKMVMVNGENAGKHHPGQGTQWHAQKPEDYYTVLPDGRIFTHDFDFNTLHGDLSKAGKGGAEAPGPAHKPTAQAGPLLPDAPSRQQNQPPKQRFRKPPAPITSTRIPKLRLSEKQLSAACQVCDGHQLSVAGGFQACYCFRDLAADVKLEKKESSYLLSFGGKWNEHSIFAFLDTVSRGSDHGKE